METASRGRQDVGDALQPVRDWIRGTPPDLSSSLETHRACARATRAGEKVCWEVPWPPLRGSGATINLLDLSASATPRRWSGLSAARLLALIGADAGLLSFSFTCRNSRLSPMPLAIWPRRC